MSTEEFKELFLPNYKKMYQVAFRILGDSSDAEDVVQETFVRLWNKKNDLYNLNSPEAFGMAILKNLCLDNIRVKKSHAGNSYSECDVEEKSTEHDKLEDSDMLSYVRSLIDRLPDQQREVMILRHWGEYSMEDIENRLGLSSSNARVLLSRGRKKIKEWIEKKR